jgi:outer membrane immunogenic protein
MTRPGEIIMKKLLVTSIALAALMAPAIAADMKVKAPILKAPPPIFSWTGFYFGGFAGVAGTGSVSSADAQNPATVVALGTFLPGTPAICDGGTPGLKIGCIASYNLAASPIAGGTAGYNWQFGKTVAGLEAEWGYIHLTGSGPLPFIGGAPCGTPGNPCVGTFSTTVGNWFGTVTARLGITADAVNPAWSKQVLLYAKGGAAVTHLSTSEILVPGPATVAASFIGAKDIWGFAAGAGVEWAVTKNWSVKAEYEHLGFNKSVTACGVLPIGALGGNGIWCTNNGIKNGIETGKVGANFHI